MKFNEDLIIKLLVLIEFSILIFACFTVYLLIPQTLWPTIITADVGILVFLYTLVKYHQSKRIKVFVKSMIENLNTLNTDCDESVVVLTEQNELVEFHKKIEEIRERQRKKEINRQKILNIVNSVAVNMEIEKLLEDLMPKLIEVTNSNCGVFYLSNNSTNKLEIKHSIGFSKNIYSEFDLVLGEGFIGTAALTKETRIITDIPDETVYVVRTFLGKIKPKSMLIVPIVNQEQLLGVFAFASINDYMENELEMVNLIKYYVGAAVGNGLTYEKTKRLSNELKFQNRLIQNLNDDLESKVQDRTLFLNDIIDSIKDYAIYAIDKDGIVLVWNKGAEILLGYAAKDIIGRHIENAYPEDEVNAGYIKKRIENVIREGKYVEKGWRFRKGGTAYYAEIILFARYNQRGEIIGFTNVTKDITTLKNVENSLWYEREFSSKLIEGSTRALVFTDESGFIHTINEKANEILSEDYVIGQQIFDFFENGEKLAENVKEIINSSIKGEWYFKLRNKERFINIVATILINEIDSAKTLFFYLY